MPRNKKHTINILDLQAVGPSKNLKEVSLEVSSFEPSNRQQLRLEADSQAGPSPRPRVTGWGKTCRSNMAIELLYIGNGWDWGNIHFFLVVWGSSWKS